MARRMTWPGAVLGFQAPGLAGKAKPHASVGAMAADYLRELKARQPEGPYHLCGYSFGGLVAFEMACRLREAGDEVGLVALFDTTRSPLTLARPRLGGDPWPAPRRAVAAKRRPHAAPARLPAPPRRLRARAPRLGAIPPGRLRRGADPLQPGRPRTRPAAPGDGLAPARSRGGGRVHRRQPPDHALRRPRRVHGGPADAAPRRGLEASIHWEEMARPERFERPTLRFVVFVSTLDGFRRTHARAR
ncbi:thioesterase domain-containing protein [Phenylobacterium sp. J367]|nr:thioesterase domain-containing protein [Phenylobacterium sp. J367]